MFGINGIKQALYLFSLLLLLCSCSYRLEYEKTLENMCTKEVDIKPIVKVSINTEPIVTENEVIECTQSDLMELEKNKDMDLIAQLVQAEAGNQDLTGMRYVVDVVLNRVDSEDFPNTVEDVIFQDNQFSVIKDGAFDRAAWNISDQAYEAVRLEYDIRMNYNILYFSRGKSPFAKNHFKYQDHWFGW